MVFSSLVPVVVTIRFLIVFCCLHIVFEPNSRPTSPNHPQQQNISPDSAEGRPPPPTASPPTRSGRGEATAAARRIPVRPAAARLTAASPPAGSCGGERSPLDASSPALLAPADLPAQLLLRVR